MKSSQCDLHIQHPPPYTYVPGLYSLSLEIQRTLYLEHYSLNKFRQPDWPGASYPSHGS